MATHSTISSRLCMTSHQSTIQLSKFAGFSPARPSGLSRRFPLSLIRRLPSKVASKASAWEWVGVGLEPTSPYWLVVALPLSYPTILSCQGVGGWFAANKEAAPLWCNSSRHRSRVLSHCYSAPAVQDSVPAGRSSSARCNQFNTHFAPEIPKCRDYSPRFGQHALNAAAGTLVNC